MALEIPAVAAALHGIGHQNDAEDDHEHDGGQCVDLRADLFTGHGVDGNGQGLHGATVEVGDPAHCHLLHDGNGQGLHGATVEVGDHEIVDGVGQADQEGRSVEKQKRDDDEIIRLRTNIRRSAAAKVANGTFASAERRILVRRRIIASSCSAHPV